MSLAEVILRRFKGREDHVAVWRDNHFEPQPMANGLRPEWLAEKHLAGVTCLGFYLLTATSHVWCTAIDFDNKPEHPDPAWKQKAEKTYYALCNVGLSPLVEVSQSGTAAHVWLFFANAQPAWLPRAWWKAFAAKHDMTYPEVYPRQDRLSGKGLGNLIRYPLWGESHFADVEDGWRRLDPEAALAGVTTTDGSELRMVGAQAGFGLLVEPTPPRECDSSGVPAPVREIIHDEWTLLGRRWRGDVEGLTDKSKSGIAMSITVELVRQYISDADIAATLRHWCEANGAAKKGNREDWVARTLENAYTWIGEKFRRHTGNVLTLKDAAHQYIDQAIRKGQMVRIHSGLDGLDDSIDGVGIGEVCVIAARPSQGKSAFALQWLDDAAKAGFSGLFVSLEMSHLAVGKRRVLSTVIADQEHWSTLIADEMDREVDAFYEGRAPVYFVENCHRVDRAEEIIDQFCASYGTQVVALDYLQLLSAPGTREYERVTEAMRRITQACKRNSCVMLLLCQLNRAVEHRDNGQWTPKMSDLRESGQIEQDADVILFLCWPWKFDADWRKKNPNSRGEFWIQVLKNRNGRIREPFISTWFDDDHQRFGAVRLGTGRPASGSY